MPLRQVPSSAFVKPRPLDAMNHEQMNGQLRGRPTIYR
jgi:hypothetical protein